MRSKLLTAILCLISLSIGFSSCLKSDDEATEFSVSTIVTAFGLDTVHGKHYKFSIDQLNHVIFNADSMPVGSDTILNSILIDTFSSSGYITSGITDTLLVTANNPQDLTLAINREGGMQFKIYSGDMSTWEIYTLHINVHQQEPDSMSWKQIEGLPASFATASLGDRLKVVSLGDSIFIYSAAGGAGVKAYVADGTDPASYQWAEADADGLPANIDVSSVTASMGNLYAITDNGDVYTSADGISWSRSEGLSGGVTALLCSFTDRLAGIRTADGTQRFCITTAADGTWTDGDEVEGSFPTSRFSSTDLVSGTGTERVVLTGMPNSNNRVVPWMSMDGLRWGDMATSSAYYCPAVENPSITYYDEQYYIVGDSLNTVYASTGGLAWSTTTTKFTLPEDIADIAESYSMLVDADHFVWIAISGKDGNQNQLWRGRLNKYGFKRQ